MKFKRSTCTILTLALMACGGSRLEYNSMEIKVEDEGNGNLCVGPILDGKREGQWKCFVRDRLSTSIMYRGGIAHGMEIWYNRCSGRIIEEGENNLGHRVGLWYQYSSGELVSIRNYAKDSSVYIFENRKFHQDGPVPPPPDAGSANDDCVEHR